MSVDEPKKKSKKKAKKKVDDGGFEEIADKNKTIIIGEAELETLVIDTVSDLLDRGVLAESEDGTKIDLKKNIEYDKEKKEEESERVGEEESKRGEKGKKGKKGKKKD